MKNVSTVLVLLFLILSVNESHSVKYQEDSLDVIEKIHENFKHNIDVSNEMALLCDLEREIYALDEEILFFCTRGILSLNLSTGKVDSVFAISYEEMMDSASTAGTFHAMEFVEYVRRQDTFGMTQHYRSTNKFQYMISYDKARTWDTLYRGNVRFTDMYDKNNFAGCVDGSHQRKIYLTKDSFETVDSIDVIEKSNSEYLFDKDYVRLTTVHYGLTKNDIYCHYITFDQDDKRKYYSYMIFSHDGGESWDRVAFPDNFSPHEYDVKINNDYLIIPGQQFYYSSEGKKLFYLKILKYNVVDNSFDVILEDENDHANNYPLEIKDSLWLISGTYEFKYSTDNGKHWIKSKNEIFSKFSGLFLYSLKDENEFYFVAGYRVYRAYVKKPSGAFEIAKVQKILYPNPADDFIRIENIDLGSNFEIFDIFGNSIKSGYFKNANVDISKLRPGSYFIKIDNKTYKFIKR